MRLLVDSHILIWAAGGKASLPQRYKAALSAPDTEAYISAASVWEVGIKRLTGKFDVPEDLFERALMAGYQSLDVTWVHARAVETLPLTHKDPFDRLLIAQAQCEGLTLATVDAQIAKYDVPIL